ncbi:MAG TPA: DinB family protein [Thermomicrobiales bacterium]|jgi:hypothetical protein
MWRALIMSQHASVHAAGVGAAGTFAKQDAALRGLGEAQLRGRAGAGFGFNPPAWLLWHMARIEDVAANLLLTDGAQVLDGDDWPARLGVARRDVGTGMDGAEVDDLAGRIALDALLDYRRSVGLRTRALIAALPDGALPEIVGAARVGRAREAGAFGPRAGWVAEAWASRPREFILGHDHRPQLPALRRAGRDPGAARGGESLIALAAITLLPTHTKTMP